MRSVPEMGVVLTYWGRFFGSAAQMAKNIPPRHRIVEEAGSAKAILQRGSDLLRLRGIAWHS
jgi:hypothetical protein